MPQLPEPLERLISELSRLPGVGPKTAQRLAFHLLRADRQRAESLARAIVDMKLRIGFCERCYNIAEGSLCAICSSARRDTTLLCVVETPLDVLAVELLEHPGPSGNGLPAARGGGFATRSRWGG